MYSNTPFSDRHYKRILVAFGGVTGFGAMASHIPDGGSCVVVYGPHVGVDAEGKVGTVNRRGRMKGGSCCGSAVAASNYVKSVKEGKVVPTGPPASPVDAQQSFVGDMLLPYADRLEASNEPMAELPYALFDAQDELMHKILAKASGKVAGEGKIAVVGGIQINTPAGIPDYFLPLRFDVINNQGRLIEKVMGGIPRSAASKIMRTYPKALPNHDLVERVTAELQHYGYGKNSLLCTSLCCDEVNRPLEKDFQANFGDHFNIAGLAGFAFAGLTGFGAMASHIPDGGSCLIVYGPHVGVDTAGNVGTVDRRGRSHGGACCGSAIAACKYVEEVMAGAAEGAAPVEPLDAQQAYVSKLLLGKGERIKNADDKMVELPLAMFEAQDDYILEIIGKGAKNIPKNSHMAILGGVQINTPDGMSDYFLPLRFEIRNNQGNVVAELLWE